MGKKLMTFAPVIAGIVLMAGCSKSEVSAPAAPSANLTGHAYGLVPTKASDWANMPAYKPGMANARVGSTSETLPTSYLLMSPSVRDQGQIGSCTGFCGSETNEMLKYYAANTVTPITGLTSATGASAATSHQFVPSNVLSPLFLYYVERCVINKQSISTDGGANMVNIGEALQGLTNNSGSGTALTLNGNTFKGQCTEANYSYPNPATNTNSQFLTAPGSSAIANALNYTFSAQAGLTQSSNTTSYSTTGGYFVINSSGSTLLADMKDALYNNKPVMMGFNVYDKTTTYQYFEALNTTSYTYNPLTSGGSLIKGLRLMGGHAVPIIGYIDDASKPGGGVFIVENSWGTSWGYNGYFYLPYSVAASSTIAGPGNFYVAI